MIRVKNVNVFNFMGAIHGLRNPKESWDRIDSYEKDNKFYLGKNDLNLMQRLFKAGKDHRKFTRQILVSMDITAPDYFFKEFSTYKVGTVENSTSLMHMAHKKPFKLEDFSLEALMDLEDKNEYEDVAIIVDNEVFKKIDGIDGIEVSNSGKIKFLSKKIIDTNGNERIYKEKIKDKFAINSSGYKKISYYNDGEFKNYYLHRLIAMAFIPNPENKPFVNHKDGNKLNNNIDNLEWCTHSENIIHAYKNHLKEDTGYAKYIRRESNRKLTEDEINDIRAMYKKGIKQVDIAKKYNLYSRTVNNIVHDNLYRQIEMTPLDRMKIRIDELNELRNMYLKTKDPSIWKAMMQLIPMSYNYTRHLTLNYEVLYNMYNSRKNHKLTEWREFCKFIKENMPYFKEIGSIEEE